MLVVGLLDGGVIQFAEQGGVANQEGVGFGEVAERSGVTAREAARRFATASGSLWETAPRAVLMSWLWRQRMSMSRRRDPRSDSGRQLT